MTKPFALALLAASLLPAAAARGDGLPFPVDANAGAVASRDGAVRYRSATEDGLSTVTARRRGGRGETLGEVTLRGRFALPLVSYDGSVDGLSHDGRTLVVIRPRKRFPRSQSLFAVLRAGPERGALALRRLLRLRGDFSFDALSPDGRSLYLIEYISRIDPAKYRVRVLDLERGRLDPRPISDPHRLQTRMNGHPYARATSPDGRWAYTLYDGRHHAFVHALDTRRRWAMCIDLHRLRPDNVRAGLYGLSFDARERKLEIVGASGGVAATIDPRTFAVEEHLVDGDRPPDRARAEARDGTPWAALAGVPLLLAAGALRLRPARDRAR